MPAVAFSWLKRFKNKQKPTPAATLLTTIRGLKTRHGESSDNGSNSSEDDGSTKRGSKYSEGDGSGNGSNSFEDDSLEADLPRFGPIYGKDNPAMQKAKDLAWEHILIYDKRDDYFNSITKIQTEAMQSYDVKRLKPGSEFQEMMVKGGCFFLQLALYILGGGELLGYSDEHPYFGKDRGFDHWIPALFFVGNQIPFVVIRALMKQNFYQQVIHSGTWRRPPQDLLKLVLYQTVVEPELKRTGLLLLPPPHSDILQALHCLLLGPGNNDPVYSEMKAFPDLEAAGGDYHMRFPSAGEMLKSGIWLRKANKGITNIHFRNLVIHACLYVPPLMIDSNTIHVLKCVAGYEQNLNEGDREVSAYFQLMRDLAPTYNDFKILERSGIIEVKENDFKYDVLTTLNELVASHRCNFTLNFRDIRRKIKDYEKPPWGFISLLLGLITVVNTTFAILSSTPTNFGPKNWTV